MITILTSHLRLGLPSDNFPAGFPTKILYAFLFSLMRATYPAHINLHCFGLILFNETISSPDYMALMNHELERMWKETVVVRGTMEELRITMRSLSQDSHYSLIHLA
jgi:hypothetical protein